MPYTKPIIDESGLHIPLYTDIRDDLIQKARGIFGDDIYLEPDSQDYELIAEFSDKLDDAYKALQMVYNNRSPGSAIGAGLDGVVKINGIRRKGNGHSQCAVVLTGDAGTRVFSGIAKDKGGHLWDVGDVVFPASGKVEVMATCRTVGAVYADAGTITKIVTQTNGWLGVNNPVNALPGQTVESDPTLKGRQAISTAKPSKTVLLGIMGGIAEIPDVLRHRIYENDTNIPDKNGIPGHSISAVVEGGDTKDIAHEIYLRKTPGSGTYGDVIVPVESPDPSVAMPPPICFFRPQYVDVFVEVRITPRAGFVYQLAEDIGQNITDYLNALEIGGELTVSALYVPANRATPDITAPLFSIQTLIIGTSYDDLSRDDMPIAFNQVTRGIRENVRVIVL